MQLPENRLCPNSSTAVIADETVAVFDAECLEPFVNIVHQSWKFNTFWVVLFTVIYSILAVLAFAGNALVIFAVFHSSQMRSSNRNVFITNLAIANFLLSVLLLPLLLIPDTRIHFPYNELICKFANALPGSNCYCSTLTIAVMAVDRYYSIRSVTAAPADRKQRTSVIFISVMIWLCSFVLSTPLILAYNIEQRPIFSNQSLYVESPLRLQSYTVHFCKPSDWRWLNVTISCIQVLFLYVIPLMVLLIFNARLNAYLRANERRMLKHQRRNVTSSVNADAAAQNGGECGTTTANSATTNPKKPMLKMNSELIDQNAKSAAPNSRMKRTSHLLMAMAASYAILWLPFTVMSFVDDFGLINLQTAKFGREIDEIGKLLSLMSICVNPLLYGFMNSNFQREFKQIFSCFLRSTANSTTTRTSRTTVEHSPLNKRTTEPETQQNLLAKQQGETDGDTDTDEHRV